MNAKMEDLLDAVKLGGLLHKKEEEKSGNCIVMILAIIGAVAAVAGIAYAVYRYFTPDYFEDYDDDFDDDYDDDEEEDSCDCGCKSHVGDKATKVSEESGETSEE